MSHYYPSTRPINKKNTFLSNVENSQNLVRNPAYKLSFRGIRKNGQLSQNSNIDNLQNCNKNYLSPIKIAMGKGKDFEKKDCNKFSTLLESKGFSNCGSASKKFDDSGVKAPMPFESGLSRQKSFLDSTSKFRINTDRSESKFGIQKCFSQINTYRRDSQPVTPKANIKSFFERSSPNLIVDKKKKGPETQRGDCLKNNEIQQKCREIKSKQYPKTNLLCELNSLNKLKNKLMSPLKRTESEPVPVQCERGLGT